MKKNVRNFLLTFLAVVCMVSGLAATPVNADAKEAVMVASEKMSDAPTIKLDKTYQIAAHDFKNQEDTDILSWYVNKWNYFHFVKFTVKQKQKITLKGEETGGADFWYQVFDADGDKVTEEYHCGKRTGILTTTDKFVLEPGTYYLGLQPHSTAKITVKSDTVVKVAKKKIELDVKDSTTIDVAVSKAGNKIENPTVTYQSSDPLVAKVSSYGKVVAVAPGTCKITVKYQNTTGTVNVVVRPKKISKVQRVSATKNSIKLSWAKQDGVDGYEIWMYDRDFNEYTKVKTVSKDFSSGTVTHLESGKNYSFRVAFSVLG